MTDRTLKGIWCALSGFFLFSSGDVVAKLLQRDGFGPFQISFGYAAVSTVLLLALSSRLGGLGATLTTRRKNLHFLRASLNAPTLALIFFALSRLPLTTVYAGVFLAPFLTAALAVPVLNERPSAARWLMILAGFSGVLIALRPDTFGLSAPILAVLVVAACTAARNVLVARMGPQETLLSLGLFPSMGIALFTLVPAARSWIKPDLAAASLLLAGGAAFGAGLLLTSLSFRYAPAAVAAPFHYSQIVWGVLAGLFVFHDAPDAWTLFGCAMIIASDFALIRLRDSKPRPAGLGSPDGTAP